MNYSKTETSQNRHRNSWHSNVFGASLRANRALFLFIQLWAGWIVEILHQWRLISSMDRNSDLLRYLLYNQLHIACPLLPVRKFIKYCRDRGVKTSKGQLERFEELGLFHPVARLCLPKNEKEHPSARFTVEYLRGHKMYRDELGKDKDWDGETEEVLLSFSFTNGYADRLLEAGLLWEPATRSFASWEALKEGSEKLESYYSPFQCYVLADAIEATTITIRAEDYVSYRPEEVGRLLTRITERAEKEVAYRLEDDSRRKIAVVCQILSNRYFPFTQTNRRTMKVSGFGGNSASNFFEYVCGWDAETVLEELDMTADEVRGLQETVALEAKRIDPLKYWYGLVSFVSVSQRGRLEGKAQLAQTYYSMEYMLRLFYEDLTGEKLDPPDESPMWRPEKLYGEGVTADELEYLELLTNHFDLNPKPKLLLIVEGTGEYEQLPRLIEGLFGTTVARLGIRVQNLQGIASFTGNKRQDKYGALERFIDDHHSRQTYVFVILDNEGRAFAVREKLVEARSRYASRTVTQPELIHLWDKSIEFDNFSREEIAASMTKVCGHRYTFNAEEVKACKEQFGVQGDPLSRLYEEKLDYGLEKHRLLEELVGIILATPESGFDDEGNAKRPLVGLLDRVVELVSLNHQPITREIRQENQVSGHLGAPLTD